MNDFVIGMFVKFAGGMTIPESKTYWQEKKKHLDISDLKP